MLLLITLIGKDADEDDGMMLKLMLPSTVSPTKYDIFRTGRSFASSGKSFFPIPARKKRYYVPLKALWGQMKEKIIFGEF